MLEQFRTAFKGLGDASRATYTWDGKTEPILAQWGIVGWSRPGTRTSRPEARPSACD